MARRSYLRSLISSGRYVPLLRPQHLPLWGGESRAEFASEFTKSKIKHEHPTDAMFSELPPADLPRTLPAGSSISTEISLGGIPGSALKAAPVAPAFHAAVPLPLGPAKHEGKQTEPPRPTVVRESNIPSSVSHASAAKALAVHSPESPLKENPPEKLRVPSPHPASTFRTNSYLQGVVSSPLVNLPGAPPRSDITELSARADVNSEASELSKKAAAGNSLTMPPTILASTPVHAHQLISSKQVEQKQTTNLVRIGIIDIHISPPPAPVIKQHGRPRVPVPAAAMSRGFTSSFGLNQG